MSEVYIDDWLKKVEIDFYQMFINAWIPFNAWYMRQYYDYDSNIISDRSIIGIIKSQENPYKTKIQTLLQGNSIEAITFKQNIKNLHLALQTNIIPNEADKISFSQMKLSDNPTRQHIENFNRKSYKFEYLITQARTTKRFKCDIIKSNQNSIAIIELHKCIVSELEEQIAYNSQNDRIKELIKKGFNEINPNKPTGIVSENNSGIKIDENLYFINNINLVCQFIIEMLYQLRCKIFHGEIDPKNNYMNIYENAYYIQKTLVKSLN
jgi:hypothetical protein